MSNRFSTARLSASLRVARFRSGICLAGIAAVFCFPGAISPGWATDKVAIKLVGQVAPECAVVAASESSADGTLELGDITQPGQKTYSFIVNCNAPFEYRLEATNGALLQKDTSPVGTGLTTSVPYQIAMHIPTDKDAIDDSCAGNAIRKARISCRFSNSGNRIALNSQSKMTLSWTSGDNFPVAGKYQEHLTLTLAVRQ